jgi:hypothetical protein
VSISSTQSKSNAIERFEAKFERKFGHAFRRWINLLKKNTHPRPRPSYDVAWKTAERSAQGDEMVLALPIPLRSECFVTDNL